MSIRLKEGDPCPWCQVPLVGFAQKCWAGPRRNGCGWDESKGTGEKNVAALPDNRSEKSIQAAIVATLRTVGFRVYDLSQPHAAKITPGVPDLYICGHGHRAWCEVKRPNGKLTEAQEQFRRLVIANGGEHYVWRSENEAMDWAEDVLGRRPAA